MARLDRETVVAAALRLLDEVGLDGLTLRRLAQDLGVQAPALYWHFKSKGELLDHLAEAIGVQARSATRPEPGQPWDEWLAEGIRAHRRALLAHRDGARVVAGNRPTERVFPVIENLLDSLCEAGFSPGFALGSILALGAYVGGFVLEEQSEQRRYAEPGAREADLERFRTVTADRYPRLMAAFEEGRDLPENNNAVAFEHGLRLIIDGMRVALERSRAGAPAPAGP